MKKSSLPLRPRPAITLFISASVACGFLLFLACSSPKKSSTAKGGAGGAPPSEFGVETSPASDTYSIVERGENHALYRRVRTVIDPITRSTVLETNEFTLLENALHYNDNGQFRESEDIVEQFPTGSIARRGPNKALFSDDLNSEAAFDLQGSDGRRLRGGVRAIQLTDVVGGRTLVIGTVKNSVKAQLLPPNQILWADAFDGIRADVLLDWKHNLFSHEVILLERPELPPDWDPAAVRLEVLTEVFPSTDPELRTARIKPPGQPELDDHAVVHFGSFAIVMGKAFPVEGENAFSIGGLHEQGTPVLKQWERADQGRQFLVESTAWTDVSPALQNLPPTRQARNDKLNRSRNIALGRTWPEAAPATRATSLKPIQTVAFTYKPHGFAIDFTIIPDQASPTTFSSGTYYIKTSYSTGSSVTFQAGSVIKYKQNANLTLYGPVLFPASGGATMPVFTSRNDDTFGQVIAGVAGETNNSNGDPSLHKAANAIWIYYVTFNTTIQNARICWAQKGILYDTNPGVNTAQAVSNCYLQYCDIGCL
jgi:hypothetical protein